MKTKKFDIQFSNLLTVIDSAIIEYEELYQEEVEGFLIVAIRCMIRDNINLVNKYYITITDDNGPHCVDWVITFEFVQERFDYWKRYLQLGFREIVEYSFPEIFPVRHLKLKREADDTKGPISND